MLNIGIYVSGTILLLALCGLAWRIGSWHGSVNADRESFKEFMQYVRGQIDKILDRLPSKVAESDSPLRLTELGKEIAEQVDASEWLNENLADVRGETAGRSPYEIQEFCYGYVTMDRLPKDIQDKAQQAAFDKGIALSEVLRVIAIELRDSLLGEQPAA